MKPKITGIGGVFFKVKNPENTRKWYEKVLGFSTDEYGTTFKPHHPSNQKGYIAWSPMKNDSKYFEPSENEFMLNFRVRNIEGFIEELKTKNVTILDEIAVYDYGKFVHILDCNGLKLELWESNDSDYKNMLAVTMPKD